MHERALGSRGRRGARCNLKLWPTTHSLTAPPLRAWVCTLTFYDDIDTACQVCPDSVDRSQSCNTESRKDTSTGMWRQRSVPTGEHPHRRWCRTPQSVPLDRTQCGSGAVIRIEHKCFVGTDASIGPSSHHSSASRHKRFHN